MVTLQIVKSLRFGELAVSSNSINQEAAKKPLTVTLQF